MSTLFSSDLRINFLHTLLKNKEMPSLYSSDLILEGENLRITMALILILRLIRILRLVIENRLYGLGQKIVTGILLTIELFQASKEHLHSGISLTFSRLLDAE